MLKNPLGKADSLLYHYPMTKNDDGKSTLSFSKDDTLAVKGIAITMMIFHHCFMTPYKYYGKDVSFWPFYEEGVVNVCYSLKLCVPIFAFLSAYALTLSIKDAHGSDLNNKLKHRYIRTMGGFLFIFLALQFFSLLTGKGWFTKKYGTGPVSALYFVIDGMGLGHLFKTPMFTSVFWYMTLAQIIIVMVPLLYAMLRRFGTMHMLLFSVLTGGAFYALLHSLQSITGYAMGSLPEYMMCIALAVAAAHHDVFVKVRQFSFFRGRVWILNKAVKCALFIFLIIYLSYLRFITADLAISPVWNAVIPFLIIAFAYEFINVIPGAGWILRLLGKYSMGIFMIHPFIRKGWYYDFTYSFSNFLEIAFVLLAVSFAVSFLVTNARKLCGWDRMLGSIENRLCR